MVSQSPGGQQRFWKWVLAGLAVAAQNLPTVQAGPAGGSGTQATGPAAVSEVLRERLFQQMVKGTSGKFYNLLPDTWRHNISSPSFFVINGLKTQSKDILGDTAKSDHTSHGQGGQHAFIRGCHPLRGRAKAPVHRAASPGRCRCMNIVPPPPRKGAEIPPEHVLIGPALGPWAPAP